MDFNTIPFGLSKPVPVSNASSRGSSGIIASAWPWPFWWSYITTRGRVAQTLEPKQRDQTSSSFGLPVLFRYFFW